MKTLKFIGFVILFAGCSNNTKQEISNEDEKKYFAYYVDFTPAFMPSCRIQIKQKKNSGQLKLSVFTFRDTSITPHISYSDSVTLSDKDFNYFFGILDTISLMNIQSDSSIGPDGIGVYNTVYNDTVKSTFFFWSPTKREKPREHKVIEAAIGISRKKFTSLKHQEYFESLEQYFDFGLPCKITRTSPLEVRIYGSLSSNQEQELNIFVNNLPNNKPILIDMSNFKGMGTMFYPVFKKLIKRNDKIIWVSPKWSNEQLIAIGIDVKKIVKSNEEGKNYIKQNYGS